MFSGDDEIFELTESKKYDKHRCMNGNHVDFYSIECRKDVIARIEDAIHSRDGAGSRTDERIHYNGLLSVLRRKLRDIDKELAHLQFELQRKNLRESLDKPVRSLTEREKIDPEQRILRLAGLF